MDILVLSTDIMERSVIQQVLKHTGHQVTLTDKIRDAWKFIEKNAVRLIIIDAAIQDAKMPAFIENLRGKSDETGRVYILMLTKKGQHGDLGADRGFEADDYLSKPIVPGELKARISVGVRLLTMRDDLQNARGQLETKPLYDTLTGLLNRKAFFRIAQGELERARRNTTGVSVIAMDISSLKRINDRYGRAIGDEVLQIVGQIIREKSRPYDCIGRWAGDQFTLALPGVLSQDAEKITQRIIAGVSSSQIAMVDGSTLDVHLNAGIAVAQNINAYDEVDTFIQTAVQAMLNSKDEEEGDIAITYL